MTPEEYLAVICPDATSGYAVYLYMAIQTASSGFFGTSTNLARALLIAHYYTLNTVRAGQAGVETYLMEGRRAKAFGGVGVIRDVLELTNYGMQYKKLRQSLSSGISISDSTIVDQYIGGGL